MADLAFSLTSPLFPDKRESTERAISVGSEKRKSIAIPRMLVALSLTPTSIRTTSDEFPLLPAIIDTGYNGILAIHKTHAKYLLKSVRWNSAVLHEPEPDSQNRNRFLMSANIWLYNSPYQFPNPMNSPFPRLFDEDNNIKVFDHKTNDGEVWPQLPLIGLDFFKANSLDINVSMSNWNFRISRDSRP